LGADPNGPVLVLQQAVPCGDGQNRLSVLLALALQLQFSSEVGFTRVCLMSLRQDDHPRMWACGMRRWMLGRGDDLRIWDSQRRENQIQRRFLKIGDGLRRASG
jgi:hypothetical protein